MKNINLHCPICKEPLNETLEEVLENDFYIKCTCGFKVYLEDASYNKTKP